MKSAISVKRPLSLFLPLASIRWAVGFEGHGAFVFARFGGFFSLLVKMFLGAEAFAASGFHDAGEAAVRQDARGLDLVVEVGFEDADEAAF